MVRCSREPAAAAMRSLSASAAGSVNRTPFLPMVAVMHEPSLRTAATCHTAQEHRPRLAADAVVVTVYVAGNPAPHLSASFRGCLITGQAAASSVPGSKAGVSAELRVFRQIWSGPSHREPWGGDPNQLGNYKIEFREAGTTPTLSSSRTARPERCPSP